MRTTILSTAFLLSTALVAGAGELVAVPGTLDLGSRPAGSRLPAHALLVNASDGPLELVAAKSGCGCVTVEGLEPGVLEPGEFRALALTARLPERPGEAKTVAVRFLCADGTTAELAIGMEADASTAEPPQEAPAARADGLRAAPERLAVEGLAPGESTEHTLWLANAGDEPVALEAVKPACGCTKVLAFEPGELAPGRARAVTLLVEAGKQPGRAHKKVAVVVAGAEPLSVPLEIETVEPVARR